MPTILDGFSVLRGFYPYGSFPAYVPGISVLDALTRSMQVLADITGKSVEDMYVRVGKAAQNLQDCAFY